MILFFKYFYWQFVKIPKKIIHVFGNLMWFGSYFFSINYCFKTLFSPWKKISWSYSKGFDLGNRLETLFSNFFSRIVGFVMRCFIIIFFIIYEIVILLLLILSLLLWLLLPLVGIFGLLFLCLNFQNV